MTETIAPMIAGMILYQEEGSQEGRIHWKISDGDPGNSGSWDFRFVGPRETVEARVIQAIQDYVRTPEGQIDQIANWGCFNWGDAMNCVPEEWWNRYGLSFPCAAATLLEFGVEYDDRFAIDRAELEQEGRVPWLVRCSECVAEHPLLLTEAESTGWSGSCTAGNEVQGLSPGMLADPGTFVGCEGQLRPVGELFHCVSCGDLFLADEPHGGGPEDQRCPKCQER